MIKPLLVIAIAALQSTALLAAPGGTLRTLERGTYQCALPGIAGESALLVREERGFRVINASSYFKDGKRGTYLHTGDRVVFTSGQMRGEKFVRQSDFMLQELKDDGTLGRLRCVRRGE
ncbi:elongation factor P [Altererythrobacter sp. MF3-039]|uniref:elongation factor P n=1 Tax=Altererythrobacter sp. MF3-039 TaxID=3252901 RepID=UPI00390C5E70